MSFGRRRRGYCCHVWCGCLECDVAAENLTVAHIVAVDIPATDGCVIDGEAVAVGLIIVAVDVTSMGFLCSVPVDAVVVRIVTVNATTTDLAATAVISKDTMAIDVGHRVELLTRHPWRSSVFFLSATSILAQHPQRRSAYLSHTKPN